MKYFDYAATTPLFPEVLETLQKSFKSDFANPNALHSLGQNQREQLEEQRQLLKSLLKIKTADKLYFTSCATESNNTVIRGINLKKDDVIFYSKADHPSLVSVVEARSTLDNIQLVEIKNLNDGTVDLEYFSMILKIHQSNLALVCLTSINNQSGALLDISKISQLIREKTKAHIHVDAVQHVGKIPFFNPNLVDSLSLSAHKVGGPKGVGALYLKEKNNISPLIIGGGQEEGMRSGTESLPLIKAFVTASTLSLKDLNKKLSEVNELKNKCVEEFQKNIPEIIYPFLNSSPYIFSFILPGVSSDIILRHLEMKKIYISSTSACSAKVKGFNPSLYALGIDEKFHKNFLRISFGPQTTLQDIENLALEFKNVWTDLQKFIKK